MSPYARPDLNAINELERVLRHLTDELASWRRRTLKAEGEMQTLKSQHGMVPGDELVRSRVKLLELERENIDLRARVDRAREMVTRLQQRLAFLERDEEVEVGS